MTYYLGLGNIFGHEPSACLIRDNEIVAIGEEERFVGVKHADGYFPLNSVKFCLEQEGIKISDVDILCSNWCVSPLTALSRVDLKRPLSLFGAVRYYDINNGKIENAVRKQLKTDLEMNFVSHHPSHAASAFFLSGFNKANVIVMDGSGEKVSTSLFYGDGDKLELMRKFDMPNSMGYLYSNLTEFFGFKRDSEEGTTMALAAYGTPKRYARSFVGYHDGGYKVDDMFVGTNSDFSSLFGKSIGDVVKDYADVAATLQRDLESVLYFLAKWMYDKTGCRNFCLAGGSAMNCKMNGFLVQQDFVDDVFVQPMSSDCGGGLGAAVFMSVMNGNKFDKMRHAYYGKGYSDEEIEKVLKESKMPYEHVDDASCLAAGRIDSGKIIGWFQGRMECGARALGNRSILADATNPDMKKIINDNVKHRAWFRPFCPSILSDRVRDFVQDKYVESPFMILSNVIKEERRGDIPSVVHVDGSARIQEVTKDANPKYHDLISNLKVPVVLNTSFNDKGQPIVMCPDQAIKMFFGTGMDCLFIGDYLVEKR